MTRLNKKKSILTWLMIAICLVIFIICGYKLISYYYAGYISEQHFKELKPKEVDGDSYESLLPGYLALRDQNPDFFGWLKINGTGIDYPVMQTKEDLEYYLRRDFNKEYSLAGTLFASDISDLDAPSDVVTIYGHMMKNNTMFGELQGYLDKDYFDAHRKIRFDTLVCRNEYKVISVIKTAVDTGNSSEFKYYNYSNFMDESDFANFVSEYKKLEVQGSGEQPKFGDKLLLLSTCEYSQENGRLVVIAMRTSGDTVLKR